MPAFVLDYLEWLIIVTAVLVALVFLRGKSRGRVALSLFFLVVAVLLTGYVFGRYEANRLALINRYRVTAFCLNDWYLDTVEAYNGYYLFTRLMSFFTESSLPTAFFFCWTAGIIALGWLLVTFSRALFGKGATAAGVIAFVLCAVTYRYPSWGGNRWGMFILGDNDIIYNWCNPQTIALVLGFWSILAFHYRRPVVAGVLCGCATDLHLNTGLHMALLITAVTVCVRPRRVKDFAILASAAVVVAMPQLLPLIRHEMGAIGGRGNPYIVISAYFRHPHHLLPSTWPLVHYALFALLLAAGSAAFVAKRPKTRLDTYIAIICCGAFIACLAGYLFVEVWPVDLAGKLQFFRMTIVLKVCAFLYLSHYAVRAAARFLRIRIPATLPRFRGEAVAVAALVALMFILMESGYARLIPPHLSQLERWALVEPERGAVFLVPPHYSFSNFALRTERGVMVDLKRFPFTGRAYIEWYRRICASLRYPPVIEKEAAVALRESDLVKCYHEHDLQSLWDLRSRYHFDYVIRMHPHFIEGIPPVYTDGTYLIYKCDDQQMASTE